MWIFVPIIRKLERSSLLRENIYESAYNTKQQTSSVLSDHFPVNQHSSRAIFALCIQHDFLKVYANWQIP